MKCTKLADLHKPIWQAKAAHSEVTTKLLKLLLKHKTVSPEAQLRHKFFWVRKTGRDEVSKGGIQLISSRTSRKKADLKQ